MDKRSRTVLVVDDNEEERKIFSAYLTFVGFTVITAENGEEALRRAAEELPSIILLDLGMPVLDGWEAASRLSRDPLTASIPLVAVTAAVVDELALRRAGFCGYVGKPMAPFQVLEEVERCIGWKAAVPPREAPRLRTPAQLRSRTGAGEQELQSPRYGGGAGSD